MHERTVFTRKRPNACPKVLPVKLVIKLAHYISNALPDSNNKQLPKFEVEHHQFEASSEKELDSVVSAMFGIKVKHMNIPGRTQGVKVSVTGTIGDKQIDIQVKDLIKLQEEVSKLEFTKPAYENWAMKLRKI